MVVPLTIIQKPSLRLWGYDMGLLDEFITDLNKEPDAAAPEKAAQKGQQGAFDNDYSEAFKQYCNKTPLSEVNKKE